MKFKISCPHCSHSISLADPKPGKYKPKCSSCGQPFAIVVEAGEPAKIRVGKISNSSSKTESAEQVHSNVRNENSVAESASREAPAKSEPAPAAQPQRTEPTRVPAELEATLPPVEATLANFNTMLPPSSSSKPAQKAIDIAKTIDASALEQTMDSAIASNESKRPQAHASAIDATMAAELTQQEDVGNKATGFDVTLDPSMLDAPKPTGFDVTMDCENQSVTQGQGLDQTMPIANASSSPGSPATAKKPAPSAGDFSVNDGEQSTPKKSDSSLEIERLGGYRIVKELGAGGMGKVYLARQLSLDRPCAIKTIQASWATNPKVIARFIREAYAAAQLTHHNVVQIYDLGQDNGTNFFSMELVGGGSLDDQLKSKGKFPGKLAATLILQAARGLKFAHDHGMVHRDIKPANLMLTNDGLLKIADMGLVKTPHSDDPPGEKHDDVQSMMLASAKSQVTLVGASMGTPAYMSPEQAEDAASVDKRADIYSLGCTFYALLTGRPPFDGQTLLEVITKHKQEKITRPEVVVGGLPQVLGDIVEKMTAKLPDDRYQDLDDVINDLEVFLELREDMSKAKISYFDARDRPEAASEVESVESNPVSPTSASKAESKPAVQADIPVELAGKIQLAARNFQTSPLLMVRTFAPLAWYGLCGLLCGIALLMALISGGKLLAAGAKSIAASATEAVGGVSGDSTQPAAKQNEDNGMSSNFDDLLSRIKSTLGYLLALFIGPVAAVVLGGWEGKSPLALRYRESFMSGGIFSKIYWGFAFILAILVVHYLGLWIPAIVGLLMGVLAGAGYYLGIEKPLAANRKESVESSQGLLKQLRLRGMEEDHVQHAFAKHSGKDWEELFENIFGYDAMRAMRAKLEKSNSASRKVFRAYRDKLIDRWDARLSETKRAKEEKWLAQSEKAELVASGVSAGEAQKRAEAVAASMVDAATETKQTMKELAAGKLTDQAAEEKRQRIKTMLAEARSGKVSNKERRSRAMDALLGQLLGSKFRFACAAVLLLACGMWVSANRQSLENYWQQAKSTVSNISLEGGLGAATETAKSTLAKSTEHSWVPVLGGLVTQKNVIYVAIAGLFMVWGTLCYGWKKSLIFVPISLVILAVPVFF
jgi:serine/threonine protein kinase